MAWFKVDDGFWSHPKTATLSDAAVTLWVRAGSYCCQHLTDGFVKRPALRMLGDVTAAEELVGAGLWIAEPEGWSFHDWDEYQETSETVKKRRRDARDRQRRAREVRENKRAQSHGQSHSESRVTTGVSNGVSSLPPTRPDPTRPLSSDEDRTTVARSAKRGTRLDPAWVPTTELANQMRTECPNVNLETEHRIFVDYWIAQPGQKGVKTDWDATWRNWMRRKHNDQRTPARQVTRADETNSFIQRLEEIDAAGRSREIIGDYPQLR